MSGFTELHVRRLEEGIDADIDRIRACLDACRDLTAEQVRALPALIAAFRGTRASFESWLDSGDGQDVFDLFGRPGR